ncbi:hypothetical protein VB618_18910 [Microvirga sp. CF3062]|uniref:hypothetical protein n=1 Tax=Microvirga sp. CF3062 TaxID=3110182 RepID=UPI002E762681|nr:hypothetical protein [Microvirga sp. CF3062]MEE1658274.1 hypothetical protein [Microvirga sp. CF3062]
MIKETAGRLAFRVLDDVTQRLRREAESQDNLSRAAKLNRLASVLEELRNEEENLIRRGFEKSDGLVGEQHM